MNEIKGGRGLTILAQTIEALTPQQRREWFVKIKLAEHGKNFTDIATKHRLGHGYLASAVSGKYGWSRKIVRALEADLKIDLSPYLTLEEGQKISQADQEDHRGRPKPAAQVEPVATAPESEETEL